MRRRYKKSLGQHFLQDLSLLQALVDAIQPQHNEHLIEIGPGEGVLSRKLSGLCNRLSLIELDDLLAEKLRLYFAGQPEIEVIHADALTYDYTRILDGNVRIVGNLPYNISSQLILRLVALADITEMYFVVQKELAQRICAQTGGSDYGRLTLMTRLYCQAELLFDLPPNAFEPPPKVYSSLVRLVILPCTIDIQTLSVFADVVRLAFGQRRKQVANSLSSVITPYQLQQLGISSKVRAQEITLQDYLKIAAFLVDNSSCAS